VTLRLVVGIVAGARHGGEREIVLPLDPGATPAPQLIEAVVRHEVAAFQERSIEQTELRVLTPTAILDGLAAGVIRHGGSEPTAAVDVDDAVDVALLAFADGVFEVFVDGNRVLVDDLLALDDGSHVSFVRLTPLIGC
jgi:hypothetical protein